MEALDKRKYKLKGKDGKPPLIYNRQCPGRMGSVEHFFSFAKYTDTNQMHGLHDNGCRLAFVTHYKGGLEGCLD